MYNGLKQFRLTLGMAERTKMKAKSTVRRTMKKLRNYIDSNPSGQASLEAFAMETALQWVTEDTSWTLFDCIKQTEKWLRKN